MNLAEQQNRAHLERQRRLGKMPAGATPSGASAEKRMIEALQQEVAELCAKLEAMKSQDRNPLVPPSRIKPVISAVAKYYGLSLRDLVSFRRAHGLIRARHVAMYLARALTHYSLPVIGRVLDRDHTTILHGCRQIEQQRRQDPVLDAEICELIERLSPETSTDHSTRKSFHAEKKTEKIRDARSHPQTHSS